MENVSIKARGFNAVEMNDGECVETGLTWCFRPESWCLVLQIKQKRQRFRLWAFGQTGRAAASLHTLCQLFLHDVWFVTNGLLCVVTLMTNRGDPFSFWHQHTTYRSPCGISIQLFQPRLLTVHPFIPSMDPSRMQMLCSMFTWD